LRTLEEKHGDLSEEQIAAALRDDDS
jgi:hypothetical protein